MEEDKVKSVLSEVLRQKEENLPAHPIPLTFFEELPLIWGKSWNAQNEIGKLRAVLLHRPGKEFEDEDIIKYENWYDIHEKTSLSKAQEEHDILAETLKKEGVEVFYLKAPSPAHGPYSPVNPRIWATRDPGMVIKGGAIVGRMALPWRKADEYYWMKTIVELGIPVLYTVTGDGTFEGGNVVWLDSKHVCIGQSIRTNAEGIRQVSHVLKEVGKVVEVKVVPIPGYLQNLSWPAGGLAHLDVAFGMADINIGIIYPAAVPYDFIEYLLAKKIKLIEIPPEEYRRMAANIVALAPGKVIINVDCSSTRRSLEREGVDVIELGLTEFAKSGGAGHCAVCPLLREEGPDLEELK